jgi:hypothetical protein
MQLGSPDADGDVKPKKRLKRQRSRSASPASSIGHKDKKGLIAGVNGSSSSSSSSSVAAVKVKDGEREKNKDKERAKEKENEKDKAERKRLIKTANDEKKKEKGSKDNDQQKEVKEEKEKGKPLESSAKQAETLKPVSRTSTPAMSSHAQTAVNSPDEESDDCVMIDTPVHTTKASPKEAPPSLEGVKIQKRTANAAKEVSVAQSVPEDGYVSKYGSSEGTRLRQRKTREQIDEERNALQEKTLANALRMRERVSLNLRSS